MKLHGYKKIVLLLVCVMLTAYLNNSSVLALDKVSEDRIISDFVNSKMLIDFDKIEFRDEAYGLRYVLLKDILKQVDCTYEVNGSNINILYKGGLVCTLELPDKNYNYKSQLSMMLLPKYRQGEIVLYGITPDAINLLDQEIRKYHFGTIYGSKFNVSDVKKKQQDETKETLSNFKKERAKQLEKIKSIGENKDTTKSALENEIIQIDQAIREIGIPKPVFQVDYDETCLGKLILCNAEELPDTMEIKVECINYPGYDIYTFRDVPRPQNLFMSVKNMKTKDNYVLWRSYKTHYADFTTRRIEPTATGLELKLHVSIKNYGKVTAEELTLVTLNVSREGE